MALTDVSKYINNQNLTFSRTNVRTNNPFRLHQAQLQASLNPVAIDKIIKYTHKFLGKLNLIPKKYSTPIFTTITLDKTANLTDASYQQLSKHFKFPLTVPNTSPFKSSSKKHPVDYLLFKFTDAGFLAGVAADTPINFSLPTKTSDYTLKVNQKWQYDATSILVHQLGQNWNTSFILIFPIPKLPANLTIKDIQAGVGNYLIQKDIPILDYYGHRL